MSSNLLKQIPNSLFTLTNLKFLDISNNKIGTDGGGCLSEALASATALVELRASSNMIQMLPESIGELRNLEVLDLRDNKIQQLPVRFGLLRKLLKLNLDQNQLKEIGLEFSNLLTL